MEGTTGLKKIQKLLGKNFIGPNELKSISRKLNISDPEKFGKVPEVPFPVDLLKKNKKKFILILGIPKNSVGKNLTINDMRNFFGLDSNQKGPCFYNQDWYLKEDFAKKTTLKFKWYLIRKTVIKKTRGKRPDEIEKMLLPQEVYPSAILTAYTFFAYYLLNKEILWKNDFIWCSDKDHNGDIIYTGRYVDPTGVNKNGFNIHRHLSIRPVYGLAPQIV